MVMQTILDQKVKRAGRLLGWSSRIKGFTRVLVGILFLALLHNPVQALSLTLPGSYTVNLSWDDSPSTDVVGYDVYYGTTSGVYTNNILVGNVTSYTISGLSAGVTYYITVAAVDVNGQESPFSNEINYMPGVPSVQVGAASARQFNLTLSGLIGQTYNVEASPDLVAWTVIGTVTLDATGSLNFTDTNAANFSQRFYRTAQVP
jgi:hypothetical protein